MVQLVSYGKAAFPGLAALFLVWGGISWWTLGFSAFTSYAHVAQSAAPLPKKPPTLVLTDQSGNSFDFAQMTGRFRLVTFGYLDCTGTCPITMAELFEINEQLGERGNLQLLTITLDPKGDRRELLHHTWTNYGKPKSWALATPGEIEREPYWEQLRQMGMWVDQNAQGLPIHDDRSFLVNREGLITDSFSGVPPLEVLAAAMRREG